MSNRTCVWLATVAIGAGLLASGCSSKAKTTTTPETATAPVETAPTTTAETAPTPVAEPFPKTQVDKAPVESSIDDLNRSGVLKTVYFAYNNDSIDDTAKTILQGNAAWIQSHAKYTVEIGGHCDERGSIGYNVALGDRRATAVKSYLASLGANAGKLVAISYGEEKPADTGHDETAWAKNRRAEFLIKP
ncbi:MAG TPA: peptidoglycan-associated lipoprotein Pal [Candidatus Polarisedimenticolaceae bacterium]|nr:peptidoglycan-associated lipoprotein Pal [Candidatus Polarisedimenticolaceae bacterium]